MTSSQAGADIITTNSFGANAINLGGYGLTDQVYAINLAAARIATSARRTMEQAAPEWPRFVAGAVSAPDAPAEVYTKQVRGLLDGSVDLLLLETVFDTGNAIAALDAFEECFQIWGRPHTGHCLGVDHPPGPPAFRGNPRRVLECHVRAWLVRCWNQLLRGPQLDGTLPRAAFQYRDTIPCLLSQRGDYRILRDSTLSHPTTWHP